jgi:hypothetical protein
MLEYLDTISALLTELFKFLSAFFGSLPVIAAWREKRKQKEPH